jgi:hypothetical protein
MKSTKTTLGPITRAVRPRMGSSSTPLDHLAICLKSDESAEHFDKAALMALKVGLFVLGLDNSGDACLAELTDAIYGKGSEDAAEVFNVIVSAGDVAADVRVNALRRRARAGYKKTAEAATS